MIGLDSYEGGTKETWRGWQWNRIVERLPRLREAASYSEKEQFAITSQCTVLYLCGPDDPDREAGLRRGFLNENLIAVDVNESNIERIRKNGGFGVSGYLEDVLFCWPEEWPIYVVIADTCSGISKGAMDLQRSLLQSRGCCNHTIVAFNGFRGRDKWSNAIREQIRSDGEWIREREARLDFLRGDAPNPVVDPARLERYAMFRDIASDHLHRGKVFVRMWAALVGSILKDDGQAFDPFHWMRAVQPIFNSYESLGNSSAKMDSAVYRMGMLTARRSKEQMKQLWKIRRDETGRKTPRFNASKVCQRIAALRAVRTKMMRAV